MADFPRWDYWLYENLSNATYRDVPRSGAFLGENDIRHEDYDLDPAEWCHGKHFYWTAQEAALISFYRDPDKVERTEDDFILHDEVMGPLGDDDDDGKRNIQLRKHITALYCLIRDAQKNRDLPRLIRREVYVEWCDLVGVDVPQAILNELQKFEAKQAAFAVNGKSSAESMEQTILTTRGDSDLSAEINGGEHQNQNGDGPQGRRENSFLKIIHALWEMTDFRKNESIRDLAGVISEALDEKAKNDRRFALGVQTIRPILVKARDLYKN